MRVGGCGRRWEIGKWWFEFREWGGGRSGEFEWMEWVGRSRQEFTGGRRGVR